MMLAPTLHTQRLTLRSHRLSDMEPLYALFDSPRAQYMGGPIDAEDTWYWLAAEIGSWELLGHGSWGIDTKDGQFLGQIGINKPPSFPEREIGWVLLPDAEGKGYACEAAQAALQWAWAQGLETLVSYIDPANARSIALAKRLGAVHDPEAPLPDGETPEETVVYRHVPDADGSPEAYA